MNRKLNATLIALSAAGLCLVVVLLAGTPINGPATESSAPEVADVQADVQAELEPEAGRARRHGGKSARRGLAMPYFSFGHGMRRVGG